MTVAVLHLANHCDRGGNVHLAVDLACAQAERGCRVVFASAGGRYEALLERCGVRHVALEQSLRNPALAARAAAALISLARRFRPDVLHAHMMSGAVLGRLAATLLRLPLVTTVHNSFDRHSGLMRLGDAIVAVSQSELSLLLERGFPSRRTEVVLNGTLGSARSAAAAPAASKPGSPIVLTMCGLERRKGVHDVIAAFGQCARAAPTWRLVVAGDGPERAALETQARAGHAAGRIEFVGHVDEPGRLLAQTDVFVLASYAEPFGLGILEARNAGCAVIGTRVGGIAEQLGADRYGLTVPPGRPDLIADGLRHLMTDAVALERAKRQARRDLDGYRVERMLEEYLALYRTVIHDSRPGVLRGPVADAPLPSSAPEP